MTSDLDHPLNYLCLEWLNKIAIAKKVKHEAFGQYADEASRFFDGPHDWMWKNEYSQGVGGFLEKDGTSSLPTFRMSVNKPFEAVAYFGPALMHRYPQVMVTTSNPPQLSPESMGIDVNDPMMAQQWEQYQFQEAMQNDMRANHARLFQHYSNWLQVETNKKTQARKAITEAIIKGMGLMVTELHSPRGSSIRYPKSSFKSVDDLQQDPDAQYAEDVQWIAIEYRHPINLVAREYGLDEKELAGHAQSYGAQSTRAGQREGKSNTSKKHGSSYDILKYWKIFSKNGFGQRLKITNKNSHKSGFDFEFLGDFTYSVVARGIPYPLNFPSWALAESPEEQFQRAQWPIPFWTDEGTGNGWPFSSLWFYDKMNCVWPLSMMKPVIGELRFINWCMSFLADKTAASCTTYVAVAKAAGMEIQNQLQQGLSPFTLLEISDLLGAKISDVVSFLQAPNFSIDIWNMVAQVMELIDKRTGLTELIYGLTGSQIRSATEAGIRDQNLNIRPDDMAEKTEDFYSETALKEIEAMVWALDPQDVQGVLGPAGAQMFGEHIQTQDFENIVHDYSYRIMAGSARKPNKTNKLKSLTEFGQVALPVISQLTGVIGPAAITPMNAYLADWAEAMDLDASRYMIELPPPPQPGEGPPSPEELEAEKVQAEVEGKRTELELKLREHMLKMNMDQETHDQEMDQDKEMHAADLSFMKAKAKAAAKPKANGAKK